MKTSQAGSETINYRGKHSAGDLITAMSNGDAFEATVSTGCRNIFRRNGAEPLRLKFVQKNLKRWLRTAHYPWSPQKGAEIEFFASAATLPIQRRVGGLMDVDSCRVQVLPKIR